MIIVWGSIEAKPDYLEALLQMSLEHVHRSRTEPGCISHSVQIDVENRNRLVFFEEWEDMLALQTHFAVPASAEFVSRATAIAVSSPVLKIFDSSQVN